MVAQNAILQLLKCDRPRSQVFLHHKELNLRLLLLDCDSQVLNQVWVAKMDEAGLHFLNKLE